jgi:hypothetical protein
VAGHSFLIKAGSFRPEPPRSLRKPDGTWRSGSCQDFRALWLNAITQPGPPAGGTDLESTTLVSVLGSGMKAFRLNFSKAKAVTLLCMERFCPVFGRRRAIAGNAILIAAATGQELL